MDEWELLNTEDGLALQDAMYGLTKEYENDDTQIPAPNLVGDQPMGQCCFVVWASERVD